MPIPYQGAGLVPISRILIDLSQRPDTQMALFDARKQQFGALALADDQVNRAGAILGREDLAKISNTIEATGVQPAQIQNIFGNRALGVGTQLNPFGTGGGNIGVVNPTFFEGVEEGFDTSRTLQAIRQHGGTISPEIDGEIRTNEASQIEFQKEFLRIVRNIYERVNIQFLNWYVANAWTLSGTPDAGTVYAISGGNDYKVIPIAEGALTGNSSPLFLSGLKTEVGQNAFGGAGNPVVLASGNVERFIGNYESYGAGNVSSVAQQLLGFDFYTDYRLNEVEGDPRMLLFNPNSMAMYQQNPHPYGNYTSPVEVNDGITYGEPIPVGRGSAILPEMPPMVLDHIMRKAHVDNSATYGNGMATNDYTTVHSFRVRMGALRVYTEDANVSPIMDYRFQ